MATGYGFGTLLLREPAQRRRWLFGLGAGLTLLFVLVRFSNLYGDPTDGSAEKLYLHSVLLRPLQKSTHLLFVICWMTLGPALMLLSLFDRGTPARSQTAGRFWDGCLVLSICSTCRSFNTLALAVNLIRSAARIGWYRTSAGQNEPALVLPRTAALISRLSSWSGSVVAAALPCLPVVLRREPAPAGSVG